MIRLCPCGNRLKDNQVKYCSAKCTGKYRPVKAKTPWRTAGKAKPGLKKFLEGGDHPQHDL